MTAKRFYYFGSGEDINSGVIDGDTELTLEETVGIMNELHEENRSLKFQLDECQNHKLFSRRELEKENKQLRTALKELKEIGDYQYSRIKELSDENEQLKAINKYLIEILEHSGATVEIEHIKGDVE